MSRSCFRSLNLQRASEIKLEIINEIIQEYIEEGYKLTVRQLFYQMVGRGLIDNDQKEYRKISKLVVDGRMGGRIDFNAIEDRVRVPKIPYWCEDPIDAMDDTINSYRIDRQNGQEWYTEVWSEKDALSGILYDITGKYHVNLIINRGYSSCSAMYAAYLRFYKHISIGQKCQIIYLGDHDPSGKDMIRDIKERLIEFNGLGNQVDVRPIALTKGQVDHYNPPPYFAKIKDPRAKWYIKEFGNVAWEVDALTPQILTRILKDAITDRMDWDQYHDMIDLERDHKEKLEDVREYLSKNIEMDEEES